MERILSELLETQSRLEEALANNGKMQKESKEMRKEFDEARVINGEKIAEIQRLRIENGNLGEHVSFWREKWTRLSK